MADYMRKIIYLRKEEKGISMPGEGFVRLEKRSGKFTLYLTLEGERLTGEQPVYAVLEESNMRQAVELGKTNGINPWENSCLVSELPQRIKPEQICGIIVGEKNCYLVGECTDYEGKIDYTTTTFLEGNKIEIFQTEHSEENKPEIKAAMLEEEMPAQEPTKLRDPFFEKLAEMYPFEDDEMEWCLQIQPTDFSSFPMEYWHYGNNSFLLQGFYNYRHLLYAHSKGKNYVGVPGQFHRREQYLAQRFGFPRFKGTQKKQVTVGDFGYWLRELQGGN